MIRGNDETKWQACNLCDALHRNINDDFQSVSFEIDKNHDVQVKIIMNRDIEKNSELLEDISVEFSSVQLTDSVKPFSVVLARYDNVPLQNIVYKQKKILTE